MDKIHKELLEQRSVKDLQNGYYRDDKTNSCLCLICRQVFEEGVIYPAGGQLLLAERAVRWHVAQEHGDMFSLLLGHGKALTGVSETQEQVLRGLYDCQSDRQIALAMGSKSESTIRNHRFQLRKRKREAKIFLALMELLEKDNRVMDRYLKFSTDLPVQDDRVNVTIGEAQQIAKKHFAPGPELVLKQWPAKEKGRLVVLNRIADLFVADKIYTEKEINVILGAVWHDHVTLRRHLIDYQFLVRSRDGGNYRRKMST